MSDSGFDPATIERRIRSFESFGIHRTGWPGDDGAGRWLVDELEAAGAPASLERFDFPRIEHRTARLSWPDGKTTGIPMYDGGTTPPGGLDGQLGSAGDDDLFGRIVVATRDDAGFGGPEIYDRLDELQAAGAVALLMVAGDEHGDVIVRNAERIDRPHQLPVLQLAPNDVSNLMPDVLVGAEALVEIESERLTSAATNVVATLPGDEPDAAPVVVMTPRSGWFTCAAERGGGLAIWLAIAEALAAAPHRRTVELVASSGHEMHHYGLLDYLRAHASLTAPDGAVAWLHLGASIGAKRAMPRLAASDQELLAIATRAIDDAGADPRDAMPAGSPGGGEAREIHAFGGRYVSFLGGHPLFHSPNDTTDNAVDPESVARYARAAMTVTEAMLAL
ncbi:MAG: hypothetical protein QF664_10490 [Dehalococcoidia bacterium]|nr:hypothetical protein [Dehalococcoidia bacterium]